MLGAVTFVKKMDPSVWTVLLCEMRSRDALSDVDYQRLNIDNTVQYRRHVQLINVLLRSSQNTLNAFKQSLDDTQLTHLQQEMFSGLQCYVIVR